MELIHLKTPVGELTLEHEKGAITLKGNSVQKSWWAFQLEEGLYGVHGHIFNPENCDIADVIEVASSLVGGDNIKADKEVFRKAEELTNAYPSTALP